MSGRGGVYGVYVSNIHPRVTIGDLRGLFSSYGDVLEVTIVSHHGYVHFGSRSSAEDSIRSLNGHKLRGRLLHVDYSQELLEELRRKRPDIRPNPNPEKKTKSPSRFKDTLKNKTKKPPRKQQSSDLRDLLQSRRYPRSKSMQIEIQRRPSQENRKIRVTSPPPPQQKLFLGNLFNNVEREDIERLFENVGPVIDIQQKETSAIVVVECSREDAVEAIDTLDKNTWMDNKIRVKFAAESSSSHKRTSRWTSKDEEEPLPSTTFEPSKKLKLETSQQQETRNPSRMSVNGNKEYLTVTKVNSSVIDDFLRSQRDGDRRGRTATPPPSSSFKEDNKVASERIAASKTKKLRYFLIFCPTTNNKNYLSDMREVFSRFGSVQSCTRNEDGQTILVQSICTERQAIQCIVDSNKIKYKGHELRVKFADGSDEDMPEFRNKYAIELRRYPTELIPSYFRKSQPSSDKTLRPIGVLPPSASLGAFGSSPSDATLNINNLIERHAPQESSSRSFETSSLRLQQRSLDPNPPYSSNVDGTIESINNKIIILKFGINGAPKLAKLIPGQMYVNGKNCLGYIIKNNTFHTWPNPIKEFLHHGASVKMDVKRLSPEDIVETRELVGETVYYSAPLVWESRKPTERDISRSIETDLYQVLKGTVIKLFPKWGVLSNSSRGQIYFQAKHFYATGGTLRKGQSLLKHLVLGDTVAIYARPIFPKDGYDVQCQNIISSSPGFNIKVHGRTLEEVKFMGKLVWHIHAEVDPYSHKEEDEETVEETCEFLATSSTLNCQLPAEKDASYKSMKGIIEEIHLPAGGIILLDSDSNSAPSPEGFVSSERRVYFHRSRTYINGVKIQSNSSLDRELAPGDKVSVDLIPNKQENAPPYVLSGAYWVALAVHVKTTERGIAFARSLRMENDVGDDNVSRGRIVYLSPPCTSGDPVLSGIAVIDSGEYAGQRVEFERDQCEAFGFSLKTADLSLIFHFGDDVYIKVKPYNSYCVDKLWVGFEEKAYLETEIPHFDRQKMKKYLYDHGLDMQGFDSIVRGQVTLRSFIPLSGQPLRGKISELKIDPSTNEATSLIIDATELGEPLLAEASREKIYIYGRCLAKADMFHIFEEGEEIFFEISPVYDKEEEGSSQSKEIYQAALVWYGDESHRPYYVGPSTVPEITPRMDSLLNQYLRKKSISEKDFESLIAGKLKPKKDTQRLNQKDISDLTNIDQETLKQAALLQQMKASFGQQACLQAMMLLLSDSGKTSSSSSDSSPSILELANQIRKIKEDTNDSIKED